MGPIIILDKSAFQSLSRREHLFLHIHFMENLTPILGMERLGISEKKAEAQGLPSNRYRACGQVRR